MTSLLFQTQVSAMAYVFHVIFRIIGIVDVVPSSLKKLFVSLILNKHNSLLTSGILLLDKSEKVKLAV
jgi:hypothetical protein